MNKKSKWKIIENTPKYPDGGRTPIPFESGSYFTRKRKPQEADRGKMEYFDKKTGKLLGTYGDGGYTEWKNKYNLQETPDYNLQRAFELGYNPDETGHLPSVDSQTGEWLKSDKHHTRGMELMQSMLNPEIANNLRLIRNEEGKMQYVPKQKYGGSIPMMPNGGRISLEEFRPKFSNSNQNIQQEIKDKQKFENSKVVQQQKTLETIKNLQEKYREKYEPSQSVKNSKSFLSAGQLAQPLNLPLKAIATGADLETSLRYALDGQYNKSIEDLVQAGVNWIPFLKQEKMLNLSKGLPSLAYRFNEAIPKINQAVNYIQKGSDIKTITEVKKNGGRLSKWKIISN